MGLASDMADNIKNALEKEGVLDLNNNERFQDVVGFLNRQLANKNITQIHRKFLQGKTPENIDNIRFYKKRIAEVNQEDKANIAIELETFKSEFANNLKEELSKKPKVTQTTKQATKKPAAMAYMDNIVNKVEEAKEQASVETSGIDNDINQLNATTQKIQKALATAKRKNKTAQDKLTQSVSIDINKSHNTLERKQKMQIKLFEFKTKSNIKKALRKWWKRIKAVMAVVGLFLLGDVIKKIALGVVEITEPIWRPFIDWTMRNFPKLTFYIQNLSEKFKSIADKLSPFVDFFKQISGEKRKADFDKIKKDITDYKLLSLDEARDALNGDGSDLARLAAYAATGLSIGMIGGFWGAVAGVVIGATIALAQNKIGREKAFKDIYNALSDGIKALEKQKSETINQNDRDLIDLHIAKLKHNKEVIKTAWIDYELFGGTGIIKRKKALNKSMQNINAQELKIGNIPVTTISLEEGSEADIEMENKLRDFLRDNAIKTKSNSGTKSSDFSANNSASVNTTTNNNIASDTQDNSVNNGVTIKTETSSSTSVVYQASEAPFAPTL